MGAQPGAGRIVEEGAPSGLTPERHESYHLLA